MISYIIVPTLIIILMLLYEIRNNLLSINKYIENNNYLVYSKDNIEKSKSFTSYCEKEMKINYGKWLDGNFNEVNIKKELSNGSSVENILHEIKGLAEKEYIHQRGIAQHRFKIQGNIDVRNSKKTISEVLEEEHKTFGSVIATFDKKRSDFIKEYEELVIDWCTDKENV